MEKSMEELRQLRQRASELLLQEEWKASIHLYDRCVTLSSQHSLLAHPEQALELKRSLCLAFSNRAEARSRLEEYSLALADCDLALELDGSNVRTLVCKGKILLELSRYSAAIDCLVRAAELAKGGGGGQEVQELVDVCRKLQLQSRTGNFDLSQWVLGGFKGKIPVLGEFVGSIKIGRSENDGGRGIFAVKELEAGALVVVTNAVAIGRAIGDCESAQFVVWKDFVDRVVSSLAKCTAALQLVYRLSTGDDEQSLEIPDIALFRPESDESSLPPSLEKPDIDRILKILDVNSLTEDAVSAKVLGKNRDYYGVGLWVLPSFINHSCSPNARRLHVGDHIVVHTSKDVKAGEEMTFAYFDVLLPLKKRSELSKGQWRFNCHCKRCRFEEVISVKDDYREIERMVESETNMRGVVIKLEERMKKWGLKSKEKGYLRASFWVAYSSVFMSGKATKSIGRGVPSFQVLMDSVVEVTGGDERLLKLTAESVKVVGEGSVEMEKFFKLGRGVYGKVVKKHAMKSLLHNSEQA